MGRVHTEGIRRVGNVEVAAIAASNEEKAKKFAAERRRAEPDLVKEVEESLQFEK